MNFGEAIEKMKAGGIVWREGWNGRGMYLFLVRIAPIPAEAVPREVTEFVSSLVVQPYIVMKTAQGTLVPWLASQTDMLAEDWQFHEDGKIV